MEFVFNNLDEYILVINNKGNIKYCNDCLLKKLGYSKKDIYEKDIYNILYNQENYINKILNNENEISLDLTLYSDYKEKIDVTSKIVTSKWNREKGIFIISKDISEKFYSKKDLENLLDNHPYASWIKDVNGKYLYANSFFSLPIEQKNVLGKYDYEIWEKDILSEFQKTDKKVIEEGIPKLIEERRIINGDVRWYETCKAPISENGKYKYLVGTSRDITLRKSMEEENSKKHKYISNLYDILNEKYKENDLYDILNNISHNTKEYLEADGLSIFLYDKNKEVLESKTKIGLAVEVLKDIEDTKISNEDAKKLIKNNNYEGLMDINNRSFIKDKKNKHIKYLGVYNIVLNNEFIGIMTIGYKSGNIPLYNLYDHIKDICSEIGIIVNNFRLSQEVKKEFDRRVEIENELELFLDTATDLIGIIDEKGNLKKINYQWSKTLGWSNEELLSMNYADLIHKDDLNTCKRKIVKNKNEKVIIYAENRFLCKNNEYKWLAWNCRYLKERKEYITTVRDITEEKRLEEERKNLQEAIHLESIKNEFFANISHEFKTPLNIILGTIQLIDKYVKSGNIQNANIIDLSKYIRPIRQNSYRLLRLVNNLIDMTRIDTGYYDLNIENSNIVSIVENITMSVAHHIENKGINLIFDTNEEELILACDSDKIERIMLNLISNAIKYTDKNGEIKVDVNCNKDRVKISVKDNGIGICKDKIDMIFDRFMQVDNSLTRRCEGSGIGLSLVKSLVEMHGGKIDVYSEVGKGSEFVFEIPVKIIKDNKRCYMKNDYIDFQIEKCNVEFSDIYSL